MVCLLYMLVTQPLVAHTKTAMRFFIKNYWHFLKYSDTLTVDIDFVSYTYSTSPGIIQQRLNLKPKKASDNKTSSEFINYTVFYFIYEEKLFKQCG